MLAKRVARLCNPHGLHLRSWTSLNGLAQSFTSDVRIKKNGVSVDGKTFESLVELARSGTVETGAIEIEALGTDASDAVNAIWELVERGFGEVL